MFKFLITIILLLIFSLIVMMIENKELREELEKVRKEWYNVNNEKRDKVSPNQSLVKLCIWKMRFDYETAFYNWSAWLWW